MVHRRTVIAALGCASIPSLASAAGPALPAGLNLTGISDLARSIVVESLPERIKEEKDWDKQAYRPGLKFQGQGLKTRLTKTENIVNHGVWKKYLIEPIDPKDRLKL